jgi:DnaJ family protein B protein 4
MYTALNVNPDATDEDIKRSFRELSLAYHPDRQSTIELKEAANMQFHKLHSIYEVLSDPVKRQAYDMYGDEGVEALDGKDTLVNKLQLSLQNDPGF